MTLKKAFGEEKAHKNLTLGVQVQWKGDDDELRERETRVIKKHFVGET